MEHKISMSYTNEFILVMQNRILSDHISYTATQTDLLEIATITFINIREDLSTD